MKRLFLMAGVAGLIAAGCKKSDHKDDHIRPVTANSSKYLSKVFEYKPAPGQLVNESLGDASPDITGSKNGLVTLGAWGGYIIAGFDHSIINQPGYDIGLFGNPIPPPQEWSEPGIVMVSQDVNGNGLPDDAWYELAGSEYGKSSTMPDYSITYYNPHGYADVRWRDNRGDTGRVQVNPFHKHNYYPDFIAEQDSVVFSGSLLAATIDTLPSGVVTNASFAFGYADSYSTGDDYAQQGMNSFDIDWAVAADGKRVVLPAVDFIKVYTGQNHPGNAQLGEVSTEVGGAVDLNMR